MRQPFMTAWTDPEVIVLSEISRTDNTRNHVTSLLQNIKLKATRKQKLMGTASSLAVT